MAFDQARVDRMTKEAAVEHKAAILREMDVLELGLRTKQVDGRILPDKDFKPWRLRADARRTELKQELRAVNARLNELHQEGDRRTLHLRNRSLEEEVAHLRRDNELLHEFRRRVQLESPDVAARCWTEALAEIRRRYPEEATSSAGAGATPDRQPR